VNLLCRVRRTKPQATLDKEERAKNLTNAFTLNGKKEELRNLYRNSHIVLVDDLYTTGATIHEAAKLVFELQPRRVSVVVVCRV
jgi:predicted amidophosphoribosyltransferase